MKYRPQLRVITDKLRHLESLALVSAIQQNAIQDGVRPTEAGIAHIAHISQSRQPWWRTLRNLFTGLFTKSTTMPKR